MVPTNGPRFQTSRLSSGNDLFPVNFNKNDNILNVFLLSSFILEIIIERVVQVSKTEIRVYDNTKGGGEEKNAVCAILPYIIYQSDQVTAF